MRLERIRKVPTRRTRIASLAAAILFGVFVAGEARAGLTKGISSPPKGEQGIAAILGRTYGGSFSASGSNYTNGTLTAVRVEDETADNDPLSVRGTPGPNGGSSSDQFWAAFAGDFSARALARFAGKAQSFGYIADDALGNEATESASAFQKLFSVGGSGYNVSGSAKNVDLIGQTWSWGRSGGGDTFSSAAAANPDGRDHVVTYRIDGLNDNRTTWALFWEDLDAGRAGHNSSMADYNDLAVEISAANATASSVAAPLPPAAWSGIAMLTGLIALKPAKRLFRTTGRTG